MGEVELAQRAQGSFHRFYAVKRLRAEYRENADFRRMFIDEARVAGMIRHGNVISVIDVGEDERGPYLVMDFVEGVTLAKIASHLSAADAFIPVQIAVRMIRQAAAGLSAAHNLEDADGQALQLVHRDVSPQNILAGYDGVVRVTDFGIAKALGRVSESTTGLLKGKSGYMAPEQLRFERATPRSDLFALGVVFYELLAGRRLYGGRDVRDVAKEILTGSPPDIYEVREDVHPAICELLFRLLAKDPEERPENASALVEHLDDIIAELSAADGAERVEDFLEEHFEDERKRQIEQRQSALQTRRAAALLPEFAPVADEVAMPEPRDDRNSKRTLWMFGVAAVLGVAGLGLAWFGFGGSLESPALPAPETQAAMPEIPSAAAAAPTPIGVPATPETPAEERAEAVESPSPMAQRTRRRTPRMRADDSQMATKRALGVGAF